MVTKRRKPVRKRRASRRQFPFQAMLWALLLIETLWLAAFVWSTGSFVPQGLSLGPLQTSASEQPGWNPEKQRTLEDLQIQKMLAVQGSRGNSEKAPR